MELLQKFLDLTIPRAFIYGQRTLDELDGHYSDFSDDSFRNASNASSSMSS